MSSKRPLQWPPRSSSPIKTAFNAAITGASFSTNLASLPAGPVSSPATFSGNGLSVEALSTNTLDYNLISFGNALTTDQEGFGLVFTNFSPNATAVGGTFFNLDTEGNLAFGNIILTASFADLSFMTTTNNVASTSSFFGFVGSTNILSLVVSGEAGLPASGQVTVGKPIPEPSTFALLVIGATAAAIGMRRWQNSDAS